MMGFSSKYFECPFCGGRVKFPRAWRFGVETVFPCPGCGRKFKTGYKMGAVLFASALALALISANVLVWLLGSFWLPVFVVAVIPLWLLYGFWLRRWWLLRKYRKSPGIQRKRS